MRFTRALLDTFIKHFPKKFIEKEKKVVPKKVFGNRFGAPEIPHYDGRKVIDPQDYIYTEDRPWEQQASMYNSQAATYRAQCKQNKRWQFNVDSIEVPRITPLPDEEWFWFRGDRVQILVGKDRGRQGIVLKVVRERNWIFVEGLHCKYRYLRSPGMPPYLTSMEQPLLVPDEVQLVDPKDLRPANVEWRWNEYGDKVRVSLRTGFTVPMPTAAEETYDYKAPLSYKENTAKDTTRDNAVEETFQPRLSTFEDDLMQLYGITDDRTFGKTYWY